MTQELVPQTDRAAFIASLNQAIGDNPRAPRPMIIRFDAVNGIWNREIDKKQPDSEFNEWVEVGNELKFHLIITRKQYKAANKSQYKLWSPEFNGFTFQLFNQDKAVAWEGNVKDLKTDPIKKEVQYVQVIYAYVDVDGVPTLHKIKMSGSNLIHWFDYLKSFGKEESVHAINTVAKLGTRMKGSEGTASVPATEIEINSYEADLKAARKPKLNLYYEIEFHKGEDVSQEDVIQRVNDVNEYIIALQTSKQTTTPAEEGEVINYKGIEGRKVDNVSIGEEEDIKVDKIPFN